MDPNELFVLTKPDAVVTHGPNGDQIISIVFTTTGLLGIATRVRSARVTLAG